MGDFLVLKRAFLNVKGRELKKYKRSWVRLLDSSLAYYKETESPSDLLESITLLDGVKAERAEKKESKEEYSIKIHNPLNKNYVPLFLASDSESEIVDWLKELQKSVDIGTSNIFGVDLSLVVKKNKQTIPVVVEKSLAFLRDCANVAGIFRVSGAQSEVLAFKAQFDRGDDVDFSSCKDPHVVANVLKLYLRELPNPLLTAEHYQKFIDANSLPADRVYDEIKQLVRSLPEAHQVTLHHIMHFLNFVGTLSQENKMPPANLAIVFGPTILRPGKEEKFEDAGNMEIANRLTERLIHNYDQIFDSNPPALRGGAKSAPLPDGWVEYFTPEGKPYYYNTATNTTAWERPTTAAIAPPLSPTAVPSPLLSPTAASSDPTSKVVPKTHSPQTFHEPRAAPGSPLGARSKSLMISPDMLNQLNRIHATSSDGEPSPPLAPARKRPPSGNPGAAPAPPQGTPDADELKQKLAKRAIQPKPPGSPGLSRHVVTPSVPPSASPSLPPSSAPAPINSSPSNSFELPPPANLPPPPSLTTPTHSPTVAHASEKPPVVPRNLPKSDSGSPVMSAVSPNTSSSSFSSSSSSTPATTSSSASSSPNFGGNIARNLNSSGKIRPSAPPRSPQVPHQSQSLSSIPSLSSLPPPPEPLPDTSDESRIARLEERVATLEQQNRETNALLESILAALQAKNLY